MQAALKGEFAMENIRLCFKKTNLCKYISHLDLVRCINRVIYKTKLPVWYTQGYNQKPFLSFPLPLSLGMQGVSEYFDIKLEEDIDFDEIKDTFNSNLPEGIEILKVIKPKMQAKDIGFALYEIKIWEEDFDVIHTQQIVKDFLKLKQIVVTKKTKSKEVEVDLTKYLEGFLYSIKENKVAIKVILKAGSEENINPNLIVAAMEKYFDTKIFSSITRLEIFNKKLEVFC